MTAAGRSPTASMQSTKEVGWRAGNALGRGRLFQNFIRNLRRFQKGKTPQNVAGSLQKSCDSSVPVASSLAFRCTTKLNLYFIAPHRVTVRGHAVGRSAVTAVLSPTCPQYAVRLQILCFHVHCTCVSASTKVQNFVKSCGENNENFQKKVVFLLIKSLPRPKQTGYTLIARSSPTLVFPWKT